MEFLIASFVNVGTLIGVISLFTRAFLIKFTVGVWALGVILIRVFDQNYIAKLAADFPSVTNLLMTPFLYGIPIFLVILIIKKLFFKGW